MAKSEKINAYLKELNGEVPATRKCIERFDFKFSNYKPHPRSMEMGYLAQLVADMPHWITAIIEEGEIDLAHYQNNRKKPATTEELVAFFDENITGAQRALEGLTEEKLPDSFLLKSNGQVLIDTPVADNIEQTLNHWVHHRGQLTVYMRMNDIPVPSIYGPSADDRSF